MERRKFLQTGATIVAGVLAPLGFAEEESIIYKVNRTTERNIVDMTVQAGHTQIYLSHPTITFTHPKDITNRYTWLKDLITFKSYPEDTHMTAEEDLLLTIDCNNGCEPTEYKGLSNWPLVDTNCPCGKTQIEWKETDENNSTN